jgi:hypothetical protein
VNSQPAKRKLYVRVAGEMVYVPEDQVTTLVVCDRTGALPHECGAYECENGCRDVELTFVRAEVLDA